MSYYDTSYPPSLWAPAPVPATGVVAGAPGSFTPAGCIIPANLIALNGMGALGQTAAWTTGQYVVLANASSANWNGTTWVTGPAADVQAPAPEPDPEPAAPETVPEEPA